jgi:hypothetical protein
MRGRRQIGTGALNRKPSRKISVTIVYNYPPEVGLYQHRMKDYVLQAADGAARAVFSRRHSARRGAR